MKKLFAPLLLMIALSSCTKDKCYSVLDANKHELCSKCFHTVDERDAWAKDNASKTPEEQCR